MKRFLTLLLGLAGALSAAGSPGSDTPAAATGHWHLPQNTAFKTLGAVGKIPTGSITALHQDGKGFLWIGTDNGFYRYDGYRIKRYKSDQAHPHLLTSSHVTAIADDGHNTLWVGTRKGLTRFTTTGQTFHYHFTDFGNADVVNVIYFTRQGQLWIGTEGGLYRYDAGSDAFTLCCNQRGNSKVPHCSVTSVLEDSRGYLWVGTWDKGLFRCDPHGNWHEMPRFNDLNSAQCVFEDTQHRLWVGTWGRGLFCISNPWNTGRPLQYLIYNARATRGEMPSDTVWSLQEDHYTGLLWVGTRHGLSFVSTREANAHMFRLPPGLEPEPGFFANGASMLFLNQSGQMWLTANRRGIVSTTIRPSFFNTLPLPPSVPADDYVSCVAYDTDGTLLLGLGHHGLVRVADGHATHEDLDLSKVNTLLRLPDGRLLAGTVRKGIVTLTGGTPTAQEDSHNTPWLADNCVYALLNDAEGNLLVGTWKGLSVRYANGRGLHLEGPSLQPLATAKVKSMAHAADGSLWLGTDGSGVMHLSGDLHDPTSLRLRVFDKLSHSELPTLNIFKVLCDQKGRVWACSKEAGLLRYDEGSEAFVAVSQPYGITDDDIYSLEEGPGGVLWIASQYSLIRLVVDAGNNVESLRFYKRADVLGNDYFEERFSAVSPRGELCFAGHTTFATFADRPTPHADTERVLPCISDVKLFNVSIESLDSVSRQRACHGLLPPNIRELTLQPSQRDLTIEFASLLDDNEQTRYAYRLENFDREWRYTEVGENTASYGNLPPGQYEFRLRSTDAEGRWSNEVTTLRIEVLAPVWQRWYARLAYLLLALAGIGLLLRYYQHRAAARHELQLERMRSHSIEELNHKKMQFFTNITHDLMTPLTIISATSTSIKQQHPQLKDDFATLDTNVGRLMRLLQQILEFRRTETGNLHLRVSQGDLADFVRREVESIRPLTKAKHLDMSVVCSPSHISAYFDKDKVDKILYNLISNAAKYNRENGFIQVVLVSDDGRSATVSVKDNGMGIDSKKLPEVFSRFYEGEHRRFNTYGTGIGLSLAKDLTELHHGTIGVESTEGVGTTFTVTLPIGREAYADEEIDDTTEALSSQAATAQPATDTAPAADTSRPRVLVVEDNDDLLALLRKLLECHYQVLTAYNGKEALEILDNETVDLIVTDVMMPVMDGIELTRAVRQDSRLTALPVLMLTAKRDDDDRAEAYRVGADAYITKPFNSAVLLARIENLLEHQQKTGEKFSEELFAGLKDVKIGSPEADFIKRCSASVQRHLADTDFDLPSFAKEMNMSTSALYKRLRAMTGLSTSAFIRAVRMKAACKLLQENAKARVSDVAYAVGYTDPKYFSNCFKKETGMLPSDYAAQKGVGSSTENTRAQGPEGRNNV